MDRIRRSLAASLCRQGGLARVLAAATLALTGTLAGLTTGQEAEAQALGRGNYQITGSVFGTDTDGLIGEETSNGRLVRPFDRMVALPACTESSCPWLELDADPDGRYGSQTACAESDGLCWVQVFSEETGKCAVAPVLDRGPLFVRDDWWKLKRERVYTYNRGLPAAEKARDGADLGFGRGISDAGHDVQDVFTYAAAIDLSAGTWVDLGLDPDQGVADLKVKLLWQARTNHLNACGGDYGNGQTIDDVRLREGPSTDDDIITNLPANRRLSITGAMQNGFYLVDVDGMRGWVFSDFVRPDGGETGAPVGFITDEVNFRTGPSTAEEIHQVVPEGSVVVVTGAKRNGFFPVTFDGKSGWISESWLDLGETPPGGGDDDGDDSLAETTDRVNFRTGPGLNQSVIRVLEAGTEVLLNGAERNGFFSVTFNDADGWIHGDYLLGIDQAGQKETMVVTDDLNLRGGPSTNHRVIKVMPPGAEVTITGPRENGFFPVVYAGMQGWAHYKYLT